MKFRQQPGAILMVRPQSFGYNPQTADSNSFQHFPGGEVSTVKTMVNREFETMVELLRSRDVRIVCADDTPDPVKPDAVFPNNWISFQPDGKVILYPLLAPNRRPEKREDIVARIREEYRVTEVLDLSEEENKDQFLEGTGSLVFDHVNRIGYASVSPRTSPVLVKRVCDFLGYRSVLFHAVDEQLKPVYHTNVVMAIGEKFAVLCLDAIRDEQEQELLLSGFERSGHKVVAISHAQMHSFAGNMMEIGTEFGESLVVVSQTAFQSLLPGQVDALSRFSEMLPVAVPTIEKLGGGSVRCMMAGIHLPRVKG